MNQISAAPFGSAVMAFTPEDRWHSVTQYVLDTMRQRKVSGWVNVIPPMEEVEACGGGG